MRRRLRPIAGVAIALLGLGAAGFWLRGRMPRLRALVRLPQADRAPTPSTGADAPQSPPGAVTPRGEITIDPRRQQVIGVRTVTARKTTLAPTTRTVGIVRYAETRLADVNVKLEGWIRDLFVDYTGQAVAKGQPLFTLYSPDLLATEQEYLLALTARDRLRESQIPDARERADELVASARRRLALWDLSEEQLRELDETRDAQTAVTFRSPASGVVVEKTAIQGLHVAAGQTLYKIADLSVVWVEADVYESELPLVRPGARAVVTFEAYPGERFTGRVVYVYPYVDEKTRTNKVRFELRNPGGRLKPGLFATVEITAPGAVAVAVPADAVLDSGTEQIVFVAKGDGYFEPRPVKVGRRAGDQVQIVAGLEEGEQVAAGAAFFLDSESQLRASLRGWKAPAAAAGPATGAQLDIALRTVPDPPRVGENQLEAIVRDAGGRPVDGAEVTVELYMPAMPTMNMPAMRSEAKLLPAGGGAYRGPAQVLMAGRWDATVTVTRGGRRLGSRQLPVVAR